MAFRALAHLPSGPEWRPPCLPSTLRPRPTHPPNLPAPILIPQGIHPASSEYWGSGSYKNPTIMAWIKDFNAKAGRAADAAAARAAASARVAERRAALKGGKGEEKAHEAKGEAKAPVV
jgi:hypothetical protein